MWSAYAIPQRIFAIEGCVAMGRGTPAEKLEFALCDLLLVPFIREIVVLLTVCGLQGAHEISGRIR